MTLCISVAHGRRTSCWQKWHTAQLLTYNERRKTNKRGRAGRRPVVEEEKEENEVGSDEELEDGSSVDEVPLRRSARVRTSVQGTARSFEA